jgi:hypothetical protein
VTPEHLQEIVGLCEATEGERGFRELPQKTTLTFYLSKEGVGLTITNVEAVQQKGTQVQGRTTKGDLYVFDLSHVFAVNIEGRASPKKERRAGFSAG